MPSRLAWDRLSDLRRLPALRGWQDGAPPGQRNTFVFVGACLLATARLARDFRLEVRELAREFAPSWSAAEVTACVSSVLNRAEAAHRGEKVEFRGEDVDPRYRFSNARLVDLFCISETEQEGMKTIIGRPEGRRRDRARKDEERRASGSLTRAEYLRRAQAVGGQARELKGQGLSLSQIAKTMGISKASAGRHCSQV